MKVKLKNHPTIIGIPNIQNTCYINSILQALASLYNFNDYICQLSYKYMLNKSNIHTIMRILIAKINGDNVFSEHHLTDLVNQLLCYINKKGWIIQKGEQDALEFYHVLLDIFDDEIPMATSNYGLNLYNISTDLGNLSKHNNNISTNSKSPFLGILVNLLTCNDCNYNYPLKFETFNHLTISIDNSSHKSDNSEISHLDTFIYSTLKPEIIKGVKCEKCYKNKNSFSNLTKQVFLVRLPKCLSLHIQRLSYSNNINGLINKNEGNLNVPSTINLDKYCLNKHLDKISKKCNKYKIQLKEINSYNYFSFLYLNFSWPLKFGKKNIPCKPNIFLSFLQNCHFNTFIMGNNRYIFGNVYSMDLNLQCDKTDLQQTYNQNFDLNTNYKLKAIIQHHTINITSGHFTTLRTRPYYKDNFDGANKNIWFYISDDYVRPLPMIFNNKNYVKVPAYMIFYEKL
ncbi:unnamed protein product [Gordionus sp. m RMFG-2023]